MGKPFWAVAALFSLGGGANAFAQQATVTNAAAGDCPVTKSAELKLGDEPFAAAQIMHCDLPPTVVDGDDYGGVQVSFQPPVTPPPKDFAPTSLFKRLFTNASESAYVVMQVNVRSQQLGEEVAAAIIPLMEYKFTRDSKGVVAVEKIDVADRLATPRFRIDKDLVVRPQIKIVQLKSGGTSITETVAPLAKLAGDSVGAGVLLSTLGLSVFRDAEQGINTRLNTSALLNDSGFDLGFGNGGNALSYTFKLAPEPRDCREQFKNVWTNKEGKIRACEQENQNRTPVSLGTLVVKLDRVPSLIGDRQSVSDGLPNYRMRAENGSLGPARVLSARLKGGERGSVGEIINDRDEGYNDLLSLNNYKDELQLRMFEAGCANLRKAIGLDGNGNPIPISMHDRYAAYFAKLSLTGQLDRADVQKTRCISKETSLFASYHFALPELNAKVSTPPMSYSELDKFWKTNFLPTMKMPPGPERDGTFTRLLKSKINVSLRAQDGFQATMDNEVPREDVISQFRDIQVVSAGCYFRKGEGNGLVAFARATTPGGAPAVEDPTAKLPLYRLELGLVFNDNNDLMIDAFRVTRPTKAEFEPETQKYRPSDARCLNYDTAPSEAR